MRLSILLLLLTTTYYSLTGQIDLDSLLLKLHDSYSINEKKAEIRSEIIQTIKTGNQDSMLQRFDRAIQRSKQLVGSKSPVTAFLYHQEGKINYSYEQNFGKALVSFRNAIDARQLPAKKEEIATASLTVYEQALSFFSVAACNSNLKQYVESIDSFKVALALFSQLKNEKKQLLCYQHIGMRYYHLNNIYEAKNWLEKAYNEHPNAKENGGLCLDLGLVRHKLKQYSSAIEVLLLATENSKNRDLYKCYNELGLAYRKIKKFDLAVQYSSKSLTAFNDVFDPSQNNAERTDILVNLGMSYLQQEKYETAKMYLDSAKTTCETDTCSRLNLVYHNLGDFYLRKGEYKKAISAFQKAIHQIIPFNQADNMYANPSLAVDLDNAPSLIQDYELKGKAFFQWFQKSGDQKHLDAAFDCFQIFKTLMQRMQQQYANENTELFWLDAFYPSLENGLVTGFTKLHRQPDQQETYFNYMLTLIEQNKANVLLEYLRRNQVLNTNNQPKLLHQLAEDQSTVSLQIQQELLDEKTAFLEYFVGDHSVFLICITKDQKSVYQFPIDKLKQQVSTMRELLHPDKSSPADFKAYAAVTNALYSNYLKEAVRSLPPEVETLIIAPDGPLNNIPLDLVLTEQPTTSLWAKNTPYLLKDYTVTYAYSASVLLEQTTIDKENTSVPTVFAFAPSFNQQFEDLKNKEEVNGIQQSMATKSFVGEAATKEMYYQSLTKNGILHLATHALIDEQNEDSAFVAFGHGERLYMNEIYQQPGTASMVVLSACKTGVGHLKRGEGVMSLARAYSAAGIPSTTMSMWRVNDLSTGTIMNGYYKYLSETHSKPVALRQAKLDYLDGVDSKSFFHPFYWGAFVHYGSPRGLPGSSLPVVWLVVGLAIVSAGLFVRYKQKKTRRTGPNKL